MLKRTSIAQVKSGQISTADGYLVIAMRVYPRFLPKFLIHEYVQSLSPQAGLFGRYRDFKKSGHTQNEAFTLAEYETVFELNDDGMKNLSRLTNLSKKQDVYMICQCDFDEYCHVDLMLLLAHSQFNGIIGDLAFEYPIFRKRLLLSANP